MTGLDRNEVPLYEHVLKCLNDAGWSVRDDVLADGQWIALAVRDEHVHRVSVKLGEHTSPRLVLIGYLAEACGVKTQAP